MHGHIRFTLDLDLAIQLEQKNIENFLDTISKLGYKPRQNVTMEQIKDRKTREYWTENKGIFILTFIHRKDPFKLIDVFVREPIKFSCLYRSVKRIKTGKTTIPVVSINHLLRMKEIAGRSKDTMDAVFLREIKRSRGKK